MRIGEEVCRKIAQRTGGYFRFEGSVCKVELPDAEIEVFEDGRGRIKPKVNDPNKVVQVADQYARIFKEVYLELGLMGEKS